MLWTALYNPFLEETYDDYIMCSVQWRTLCAVYSGGHYVQFAVKELMRSVQWRRLCAVCSRGALCAVYSGRHYVQ